MRELGAFDYALVGAVSVLAYLQLPWRPAIRGHLRGLVAAVLRVVGALTSLPTWAYVLVGLGVGVVLVVGIVESPALLATEEH